MLIAYILASLFAMAVCVFGPAIGRRLKIMGPLLTAIETQPSEPLPAGGV